MENKRDEASKNYNWNDPKSWADLLEKFGPTAYGVGYHDWTHSRRLKLFSEFTTSESRVLDIGCGPALFDCRYGPFKYYTGIDFCIESIVRAQNMVVTKNHRFVHADARQFNFSECGSFDVAILSGIFVLKEVFPTLEDCFVLLRKVMQCADVCIANLNWTNIRDPGVDTLMVDVSALVQKLFYEKVVWELRSFGRDFDKEFCLVVRK